MKGVLHSAAVFVAVTPSDTVAQPSMTRLYVGGAGDIVVVGVDGVSATFKAVPVGTILPISPSLIKATLTTATLMLALG